MIIYIIAIFILSAFLGYYIVWNVSPSLHSPLMSVSNAISGVVILGGIKIAGETNDIFVLGISLIAIFLASVNLSGGFVVSGRMLELFKKRNTNDR